jgi:hypothetical protein
LPGVRRRIPGAWKAEGPDQRQLTGASWENLAESCLKRGSPSSKS